MGAEIKALDSEVPYLQNEIKEAKRRLRRTEFQVSLERKRLAGKLHALRRRAERIQRRTVFKLEKSEELEATLSEAKRQNLESLRTLKKVRGIMHNHLNPRPLEHGIQVSHSVPFFVDTHETTSPTLAAWQSAAVKGEKFPHFAFQLLQM
jgi:predicted RNase H-like nuclease (RuvC/YqgF family)